MNLRDGVVIEDGKGEWTRMIVLELETRILFLDITKIYFHSAWSPKVGTAELGLAGTTKNRQSSRIEAAHGRK